MNTKIINLFSFLNSKEGVLTTDILSELNTIDDFKKFKNIPKETLDFLICKYSFNPDNKYIVDYLKSLGGGDELFNDVKQWMDDMFKDLKEYTTIEYPLSTYYGTTERDILITQDLEDDYNWLSYTEVYLPFENKYNSYIPNQRDIIYIFHEYLVNYLHLKGTYTRHISS